MVSDIWQKAWADYQSGYDTKLLDRLIEYSRYETRQVESTLHLDKKFQVELEGSWKEAPEGIWWSEDEDLPDSYLDDEDEDEMIIDDEYDDGM